MSALIAQRQLEIEVANFPQTLAARMAPIGTDPAHYLVNLGPETRKERRARMLRDAEVGLELELQRMEALTRRIEDALIEARAIHAARETSFNNTHFNVQQSLPTE